MPGTVYLVGAGPGAPDLLTLRAARVLAAADIVFYDALVHADTLAFAARAEKVAVGKRCGEYTNAQRFIHKRLVDAAARHTVVVRLKGGDPMLFARAQEEIDVLRDAGIAVEVVPGLSAAFAASAELRTALTRRGTARSVTLATPRVGAGERDNEGWARAVAAADTAALYMAAGNAEVVRGALLRAGVPPSTPVVLLEGASLPRMRQAIGTVAALPGLAARCGGGPTLILLGEVLRGQQLARRVAGVDAPPWPAVGSGRRGVP